MHYQLSEDEFNRLESCMRQIDLLADLCSHVPEGSHGVTIDGLQSFMCSQIEVLRGTLKAVEERGCERPTVKASAAVPAKLLAQIIRATSGEESDPTALGELNQTLLESCSVDTAYGEALRAFYLALRGQGFDISSGVHNGIPSMTIQRASKEVLPKNRKREKTMVKT